MRELDSLKIAYHSIKDEKLSMGNANRSPELQNMQVFLNVNQELVNAAI